jgi:hypothetical protein
MSVPDSSSRHRVRLIGVHLGSPSSGATSGLSAGSPRNRSRGARPARGRSGARPLPFFRAWALGTLRLYGPHPHGVGTRIRWDRAIRSTNERRPYLELSDRPPYQLEHLLRPRFPRRVQANAQDAREQAAPGLLDGQAGLLQGARDLACKAGARLVHRAASSLRLSDSRDALSRGGLARLDFGEQPAGGPLP